MATRKTPGKATSPAKSDPNAFKVVESKDTRSQTLAKLVTGGVLSAATLKQYSGAGEDLELSDLVAEMKKAGDEAVAGDMKRVEMRPVLYRNRVEVCLRVGRPDLAEDR